MREIKKKIAILVTLNLIVFGLYFYLFINIRQVNTDISSKMAQIKREMLKKEQLQSVKNLADETKSQRDKIAHLFVQRDDSIGFMEMVELLGKTAGVKLSIESAGIEALNNKTGSSTESLRLSVRAEGVWSDTLHLFKMLESAPFKISFDKVVLSRVLEASVGAPSKIKEKSLPQWNSNFSFSVLKIKNPSQVFKK